MADLLEKGMQWLTGQRHKHMTRPVTYARGAVSVELNATPGQTEFEHVDEQGVVQRIVSRDFLIRVADLKLDGAETLPESGDQVRETVAGVLYVHEVLAQSGQPPWRYSDPFRQVLRVHTKQVDYGAPGSDADGDGNPDPVNPDVPFPSLATWPTADVRCDCGVNYDDISSATHTGNILDIPLVTDQKVSKAGGVSWPVSMNAVRAAHPQLIGTYLSGNRVSDAASFNPREYIPPVGGLTYRDGFGPPAAQPWQPNVNDATTRQLFAQALAAQFVQRYAHGYRVAFLDNIVLTDGVFAWANVCDFLGQLRGLLHDNGLLLMPNVLANLSTMLLNSSYQGAPAHADVAALGAVIDGVTFEASAFTDLSPGGLALIRANIQALLNYGHCVVIVTSTAEDNEQYWADFAATFRDPGDRLFVTRVFTRATPAWALAP